MYQFLDWESLKAAINFVILKKLGLEMQAKPIRIPLLRVMKDK